MAALRYLAILRPAEAGLGDAVVAGRGLSAFRFVHVAVGLTQQGGGVGGRGTDGM